MKELQRPEYIDDIKRIAKVCIDNGYVVSLKRAEAAWLDYSERMAAGWMGLDCDEAIWMDVRMFIEGEI